jgi:TPP-dependent pyruvate/acetoin dehydrogenase alpha subunit
MQPQPQILDPAGAREESGSEPPEPEAPKFEASKSEAAGEDPVRRARDRLTRAVALLEAAAQGADARCQDRLRDLKAVRAEADSLRESQSGLAERLSAVIDRLRSILGDQGRSR